MTDAFSRPCQVVNLFKEKYKIGENDPYFVIILIRRSDMTGGWLNEIQSDVKDVMPVFGPS